MTAPGRVGILGLARSGRAAAKLALASGSAVFASDAGDGDEAREAASEIRRLGGEIDLQAGGLRIARSPAAKIAVNPFP